MTDVSMNPADGAPPDTWCTRADGHTRRTPCIKRIRVSVGAAVFGDNDPTPLYRHHNPERNNA